MGLLQAVFESPVQARNTAPKARSPASRVLRPGTSDFPSSWDRRGGGAPRDAPALVIPLLRAVRALTQSALAFRRSTAAFCEMGFHLQSRAALSPEIVRSSARSSQGSVVTPGGAPEPPECERPASPLARGGRTGRRPGFPGSPAPGGGVVCPNLQALPSVRPALARFAKAPLSGR